MTDVNGAFIAAIVEKPEKADPTVILLHSSEIAAIQNSGKLKSDVFQLCRVFTKIALPFELHIPNVIQDPIIDGASTYSSLKCLALGHFNVVNDESPRAQEIRKDLAALCDEDKAQLRQIMDIPDVESIAPDRS